MPPLPNTLLALQRLYGESIERIYHGSTKPSASDWRRHERLSRAFQEKVDQIQAARLARGRPRCRYDDEPVKQLPIREIIVQGTLFGETA